MQSIDGYNDHISLKDFLADQLLHGRLALVLGAGASMGFGLPNWDILTERIFEDLHVARDVNMDNEMSAELLLAKHFNKDKMKFANAVRKALYREFNTTSSSMLKNEFLIAIGSLTMASTRGSIKKVISFNYDDLLETYLGFHGFSFRSIPTVPMWEGNEDISVFHPHGLLPIDSRKEIPRSIVYTLKDYDEITGKDADGFRSILLNMFQSNTCLFIGLSGQDRNLTSILSEVEKRHISKKTEHIFWGIRFSDNIDDPYKIIWNERGIFQCTLSDYKDLPSWLLDICQIAAEKRNLS
jgi:hypothetical protein